ncbi:hypothetical protein [Candidatus Mycoplasma haematohominis]|uniref:Uncharacterized protein n=1 Tax=Candidatus Mycoplasma haematohominis TaxID=1494318 RepID=A0A478FRE1_9MOLU|nr:hypothetical protein [Candidatus Mycoplasma haemohominis]GCE63594.1 hypothetical protein MHSWG343_05910 [Candidatus Mycoplasma haemohominis]
MLTESKITITTAVAAFNSILGVSGYELLRIYLLGQESSEEITNLENSIFKTTKAKRKRTKETTFKNNSQSKFDLRVSNDSNLKIVKHHLDQRHRTSMLFHIPKQHRGKLISWEADNKSWWEKTYKQREYMIKSQDVNPKVEITKGYSMENITNLYFKNHSEPLPMNQFCDRGYAQTNYYKKYRKQFWLMCTVEGKDPDETDSSQEIAEATKARFWEGEQEKEITYFNYKQSKKETIKNTKISNSQDKFVVYDYSPDWWEWSYKYRLKIDKDDETSDFPLSDKFRKANSGWDEKLSKGEALNKICKDLYESNSSTSDEIEDAWRYCSDVGVNS